MSDGRATRSAQRRQAARRDGAGPDGGPPETAARGAGRISTPAVDVSAAARGLRDLIGRTAQAIAEQAQARVPTADLDDRDPDYIRESLPGLWMLCSLYFRAEARGLHNIPEEGGVLLVGNHSGGNMTPDSLVLSLAFNTYFGVERGFFQL